MRRDEGFWKFNTSLLKDKSYVKKVKYAIQNLKRDYVLQPEFSIDDDLFLKLLLMKIREMTIPYSGKLKRERKGLWRPSLSKMVLFNSFTKNQNLVL